MAVATGVLVAGVVAGQAQAGSGDHAFGPPNPFYAASTLPFQAPMFDRIKDADYEPALEAGMAEQTREVRAIANSPEPPTFENTIVALEKTGELLNRTQAAMSAIAGAYTNPTIEKIQQTMAPRFAAHEDAIYLDGKLFARVKAVYDANSGPHRMTALNQESQRLLEVEYRRFVHAGANLSASDKEKLKAINAEESTLSNAFGRKLLAATKAGGYVTADKAALAGMTDAQIASAAAAAKARGVEGYVLPLQNTTQQPALVNLNVRTTRQALFEDSWTRAEKGGDNDTRATIARLAQVRAEKGKLLGFPTYAAWKLDDQMAKTPESAVKFMDALVPAATARAASEGDIQRERPTEPRLTPRLVFGPLDEHAGDHLSPTRLASGR